jgi:acetyl esterase/lipase
MYADLRGLPPLLMQVGEEEWLCRDAVRFAERARAAGVDVTLQVWPAMWHVWHLLVPLLPEARQAVDAIAAYARRHVAPVPG